MIKENSFDGAPGGTNGISNTQPGYGTFVSPDATQTPDAFTSGNQNKAINQMANTVKSAAPSPEINANNINAIYAKKDTPTPDEVSCGIKYELGRQIKKDKAGAKSEVLKNLKKDPHFYSGLGMMGIDDETMMDNMTENKHPNDAPAKTKITSKPAETKKIFSEMAFARDNKFVVNSHLIDVMKELREAKQKRRMWQKGDTTL